MEGTLDKGKYFLEVGCDEWVDGGYYDYDKEVYGKFDKLCMFRMYVDGYFAKYVKLYDEEGNILKIHTF